MTKLNTCRRLMYAIALSVACSLSNTSTQAAPYACDLTNNSGVISFRLNEDAHNVKVIWNGGANVVDLGSKSKGVTTTANLGVTGVYQIAVTRSAASGYVQSSSNTFVDGNGVYVNKFEQPRGVAVNKNAATSSFGRIYVANSRQANVSTDGSTRTTYQGIYLINSDDTVALDTGVNPRTAGLAFGLSSASPTRLTIGKDDNLLYMADFSDPAGGVWRTDLDVTTGINVLDHIGDVATGATNHGSVGGVWVEGVEGNNLKMFTIDEDLTPGFSAWRYDIGNAALPYTGPNILMGSTAISTGAQVVDIVRGGPSNYVYFSQRRSAGTEANIFVYTASGVFVTNSLLASRAFTGLTNSVDLLRETLAMDISPDGKTLALLRANITPTVRLVSLTTNGLFDLSTTNGFDVGSTSSNNRDIAYDAAGNLYVVNTASEWLKIFSAGGPTVATTGSDGTFNVGVPQNLVTVTATTSKTLENSVTNGVFTLSRSDTTNSLVVNFTLTGTSTNGVDYVTVATNVTFNIGQSTATVTITPINNSIAQLTRSVILTISTSGSYSAGIPGSATISILDDETPEISISASQPKLLEGYSASKATYDIVRKGLIASSLTVPVTYAGTAVRGTHFSGTNSISIGAGVQTTTLTLTPVDDEIYQGERIGVIKLGTGAGFVLGSASSSSVGITDDEFPVGPLLFSDTFGTVSTDSSANWTVNSNDGFADTHAHFGFDYTTLYVPQLPGASDTRALRLQITNTPINAISVSPIGLSFTTNDYRLKFKTWINYNGVLPDGGSGSTYHLAAGVGTTGDHVNWPSGGLDGISFTLDGDGGTYGTTIGDANAYSGANLLQDDSGVYAAGTIDSPRLTTNNFYSIWGGLTAPATQLANYSTQSGTSHAGNMGMSWHTITLSKSSSNVLWHIDGVLIATIPIEVAMGPNVFIGYEDLFAGASGNPPMSFALIDNVKVETYVAPTPIGPTVYNTQQSGANIVLNFVGGFTNVATDFTVVGSSTLSTNSASYTPVGGQSITGSNGVFTAVIPMSGAAQFYRIRQ